MQLDEKWSFVGDKGYGREAQEEADWFLGDQWDHVAFDPESRLVLSVMVGKRIDENVIRVLEDVKERLGGRTPKWVTSDEYPAYAEALRKVFGEKQVPARSGRRGRPRGPKWIPPAGMIYATVHKTRVNGRVVRVQTREVFGKWPPGHRASTSYLERQNATDRHRNARKGRKTYRFSKDWEVHEAMTAFTMFSYNFCWPVRTLRRRIERRRWQQRTPAMVAGLTDHVWSIREWSTLPGVQCN